MYIDIKTCIRPIGPGTDGRTDGPRQTRRQTDKQTGRQTGGRQADRPTDRKTVTQAKGRIRVCEALCQPRATDPAGREHTADRY